MRKWRKLSRTDKVELLAYDRWRMEQLQAIRKQLGDKDPMLATHTLTLALAGL